MGNWTKVQIIGTCAAGEVGRLRNWIGMSYEDSRWSCLCHTGGFSGLPNWGDAKINAVGNLAERGYSIKAIAVHATKLLLICPSLRIKIHVGGDYESSECVATINAHDPSAIIGDPEIETLPEPPPGQAMANTQAQITGQLS